MDGAHVLFVAHDAGGTIPPVLAAARALVEGGHRVTVLSQPCVVARAAALGCSVDVFTNVGDYASDRLIEDQLETALPLLIGEAVGQQAIELAEATEVDAIVVDPNLAGALAAVEADSRPSAVLLHSLYATFVDVWFGELWKVLGTPINEMRSRVGLPSSPSWDGLFRGHDVVVSAVPAVFNPRPVGEARVRHVGFLVPRADEPYAVEPTAGPRVLVGLSNVSCLPFVAHSALLPSVDVVVTHGGLGTVAAALAHGVPLVCQPTSRDQPLNALRVAELGAGLTIDVDASSAAIAQAIRRVLDEADYRRSARALATASEEAGGAGAAAQAVLDLLG